MFVSTTYQNALMTKYILVSLAAIIALTSLGCSSSATLGNIQPTNTYPNKLHLRAAVVLSPQLMNHAFQSSVSGSSCGAWTAKIDAGNAYLTAIRNGLESALERVVILGNTLPSEESSKMYDLTVNVDLANESSSIQASTGFFTTPINAQFQTSLNLTFSDNKGKQFYMYTANGTSFFTDNVGSCNGIADVLKMAAEKALRQATDYISQSTFSAEQLNSYAKTIAKQ
jgi:hypothetical protein